MLSSRSRTGTHVVCRVETAVVNISAVTLYGHFEDLNRRFWSEISVYNAHTNRPTPIKSWTSFRYYTWILSTILIDASSICLDHLTISVGAFEVQSSAPCIWAIAVLAAVRTLMGCLIAAFSLEIKERRMGYGVGGREGGRVWGGVGCGVKVLRRVREEKDALEGGPTIVWA
ncbi:hypothetical protein Tco_0285606 [Tanacetum coccineum]